MNTFLQKNALYRSSFQKLLSAAAFSLAATLSPSLMALEIGSPLPEVSIDSKGEIQLTQESASYQSWNSSQLTGKIRTIQHIAGRSAAKKINQPFIDAIKAAKLNPEHYQTTTIINLDDAVFGTASIVNKKAENKKEEFPHSSIVVDEKGSAIKPWNLAQKSSAIIVLDKNGQVLFFKDGKMTEQEIEATITLIQEKASHQ